MLQYVFHETKNSEIYGVLSILDYETTVKAILEKIAFPPSQSTRSIVVDLALKNGINQYRFLRLDVSAEGTVIWRRNAYYDAPPNIESRANDYLKERAEAVLNSVLSDKTAMKILG